MRFARLVPVIPAVAALLIAGAAYAQGRDAYVNRENFFTVNFPADPTVAEQPYKTVKGTNLTARIFTSVAASGIQAGTYRVTVVDYTNAKGEMGDAIEQARRALLAKGKPKYDAVNNIDMHRGWALTVETPDRKNILGQIVLAANNRLYITEAEVGANIPPPAQFQASLQILDENGVRIRTRTAPAAPAKEETPVGAEANAAESAKIFALSSGSFKAPNGSCTAAYFKSGARLKTSRGEEAMSGTVVNSGVTIAGQLILSGAREGQFIDPKSDKAWILFDPQDGGKIDVSPIGGPASGWPSLTLELCPGSRA
jgi:hypothetical protein